MHARPRGSLIRTATISLFVALVPMSIALYAVAAAAGNWRGVLAVQISAIAACTALLLRQLSIFAAVTPTTLEGNGFMSPMLRVPLADIREVHLVRTYVGHTTDTVTQLLVLGDDGKRLWRMRGNFWPLGTLERIADALPVAAEVADEPMSARAFFTRWPGSEYWFENKAALRVGVISGGCLLALAIAVFVMWVLRG